MAIKRITSVDIFRGMTIAFMILVNTPGTWSHIFPPLEHAPWNGVTPTDWIFPFFLLIVGTSIVLAYKNKRQKLNIKIYKKIGIRSIKIILIGLLLAGFSFHFPFFKDLSTFRLPGVLQRIGIVFFVSALIFVSIKSWKAYLIILILLLVGYWWAMTQIPINEHSPQLTKTDNLASVIDRKILGENHMWKHYEKEGYVRGDYDPEGIFSTLPAIGTTILGIFLGLILVNQKISELGKIVFFIIIGLFLLILGNIWSQYFPMNKRLWTSSYVLYTGGLAYIFFAAIYFIADILKQKKLFQIFIYLGMNAIIIFSLSVFITKSFYLLKFPGTKSTIHGWLYHNIFVSSIGNNEWASFLYAFSVVIFYILVAWWLYRKKIFIKV